MIQKAFVLTETKLDKDETLLQRREMKMYSTTSQSKVVYTWMSHIGIERF